jgi:hypothetical protein
LHGRERSRTLSRHTTEGEKLSVQRRLFLPTARETNLLLIVGFLSIGWALYLRYQAIELASVGLACQAGLQTWLCEIRRVVTVLFNHSFFGWIALGAASLHLLRPSMVLMTIGLAATGFGIVLYNVALCSLAAALLILALARPRPVEE